MEMQEQSQFSSKLNCLGTLFRTSITLPVRLLRGFAFFASVVQTVCADPPWVDRWTPAFDYTGQPEKIPYTVAQPATRQWLLCIVYPHLKDAYWMGVNYGMLKEAKRLGVEFRLFEAGGYPYIEQQRDLVSECSNMPAVNALILGTVSFHGLSNQLRELSEKIPVLATVNDIADIGITAKVGVSWYEMGRLVGEYLAQKHPVGSEPVPIAWFPGPEGAGWVPFVDRGFRQAIADSALQVATIGWGDTGKAIQRNLVQKALNAHPEVRYLVGNALMAEAAISILRERKLLDGIKIVSTYFTPGVYRGIVRGRILAAPTDSPVLQGRLSINQAVNLLEGRSFERHMGPIIRMIDIESLTGLDLDESLAPVSFLPSFRYQPEKK